ncbi:MAG: hypothetical protein J6336_01905 [Kiritimatiellae bacterium]|nr:hypothetical protein [Kiritimatiellia bacterium]
MMKMKIGFLACVLFGMALTSAAATAGSYYGSAKSITITKAGSVSGTLVAEYDPDDKEYTDFGVFYLKFKLSRYSSCTLWGGNATMVQFSAESEDFFYDGDGSKYDDFYCPGLSFDTDTYDETVARGIIRSDDWDVDDAKSVTYYVMVEGEIGDTFTLNYSPSVVEESIPTGYDTDHAGKITPSAAQLKLNGKLTENGYYLDIAGLKVNDKVVLWADSDANINLTPVTVEGVTWEGFAKTGIADGNLHTALVANVAGTYQVLLDGDSDGTPFTLYYQKIADVTGDDTAAKAAALSVKATEQSLMRTLGPSDKQDWFKFSAVAGTYYTFAVEANQGAVPAIAFYSNAEGTAAVAAEDRTTEDDLASGRKVYRFRANDKGNYTVKVSNTGANALYTLTYSGALVGAVKLGAAVYKVKEDAAFVAVKVMRTAKEGKIRVRYTTVEGTAKPGVDYKPVTGILEWESGSNAALTVNVPLIPDLYATYEGADKTFTFEISAVPDDYIASDEYVPSMAAPTSAAITLTESAKAVPGTILLAGYGDSETPFTDVKKPVATVKAGEDLTLWFDRTVGSNGKVGVAVTTVKGTAIPDTDFDVVTENLIWEDGDMNRQSVTIPTSDTGNMADRTFTVKVTALAKDGTETLAKPTITAGTATCTIRNPEVWKTFAEWNTERGKTAVPTLKEGKAGTWFITGDVSDYAITCASPAKGQKNELTLTVAGPGVLAFTAEGSDGNMTYTWGKVTGDCNGSEVKLALPKGNQTVKFTVTNPNGDGANGSIANGFTWTPLTAATLVAPLDKNGVLGATAKGVWSAAGVEKFRVSIAEKAADIGKAAAKANDVEVTDTAIDLASYIEPGKTYFWRVDSVYDDGGLYLIGTNAVWSFKTVAASAPVVTVTSQNASAYQENAALGVVDVELTQFVAFNMALSGGTVSIAGGKLPDGLKLANNAISGVPTKADLEYSATLLVKNGNVSGATKSFRFKVNGAPALAGTFNGLGEASSGITTNQNASVGSLNVTVSTAGAITAKATVAGVAYSFKGTGYTAYADGEATAILESVSKIGTVSVTNRIALRVYNADTATLAELLEPAFATVTLNIPKADKKSYVTCEYDMTLLRDNRKEAEIAALLADWTGYYTVSLPVMAVDNNVPQGAGYVTVTLDAKGAAKIAGMLGDGTSFSASAIAGHAYDTDSILLPVFFSKGTAVIGGWLRLMVEDGTVVADPSSTLLWCDSALTKSYSGDTGFIQEVEPNGGFYDKLFNLQAYYLNTDLSVGFKDNQFDGYNEMVPTGAETLLLYPGVDEPVAVALSGNAMSIDKQVLAKRTDGSNLYDLANSVNANNVNIKFTRATGIFNGTFALWYADDSWVGDETVQKQLGGIKYQGILTPVKAAGSAYEGAPGLGYATYNVKVGKRTYVASWLFGLWGEDITDQNEALWASEGTWDYTTPEDDE